MRPTPARSSLLFLILIIVAVVCLAAPAAQTQRTDAPALCAEAARLQQAQWPSYTVRRIHAYVPGTNLTIAHVFRAN